MKTLKTKIQIVAVAILFSVSACNVNKQSNNETQMQPLVESSENGKVDINIAALTGNVADVKTYVNNGGDLNIKDPKTGSTPLITASVFGKSEVVKLLIEAGADLNIQNNEGSTALHSAAFFCHAEIVKMLIVNGADKSVKNKYNSTARESVLADFGQLKPIYMHFAKELKPLGLNIDLAYVEKTRPVIAEMLID